MEFSVGGEASIDLNYRLVCKDCRKIQPNIIEDYKNGDLICGDCGLVFPMRIIDNRSEWRTFSSSDTQKNDASRVGDAENPLLEGVVDQLSTTISGKDGFSGAAQQLSKTQGRVTGNVKGDRDLLQSFREISVMSERIGLPKVVADRAKQLYKRVFDEECAKGKSNQGTHRDICPLTPCLGIMAACLFIACRQELVPRTFKVCFWFILN